MILDDLPQKNAWWVIHYQGQVYSDHKNLFQGMNPFKREQLDFIIEVGNWEGLPVYAANLVDSKAFEKNEASWCALRALLTPLGEALFTIAAKGYQLCLFYDQHRFCGRCGVKTKPATDEFAVHCNICHLRQYPRVSPCVIVAVIRDDKILLGHHKRNARNVYTTLAGYVETGETLEECVIREIKEESGIDVHKIQYISSQPWPGPHNLMNGFVAEYASGEINIDPDELEDAQWFSLTNLPQIPDHGTIARQLIEYCVNQYHIASHTS